MEKNTFQTILYVVFGLLVLIGFGSLAVYGLLQRDTKPAKPEVLVNLTVWGTLDENEMTNITKQLNRKRGKSYSTITYREKNPQTIIDEYKDAIIARRAPDLLILDHNKMFDFAGALRSIPFTQFPVAQYQQTFIQAADIFKGGNGYFALPLWADPMVLYYNENLRLRNDIQELPAHWSDLTAKQYTEIAERYRKIDKTVIPLGAYGNYNNAADLIGALILQVRESETGLEGGAVSDILRFYKSFADPKASVYVWDRAYPDAREMFIGDRLIYYPGFVSEYADLRRANPNIVVRATALPQFSKEEGTATAIVPARMYGVGITAETGVPTIALEAAFDVLGSFYYYDDAGARRIQPSSAMMRLFSLPPALSRYYADETATATEAAIIESLFPARSIYLTEEERQTVEEILRGVVTGTFSIGEASTALQRIFR